SRPVRRQGGGRTPGECQLINAWRELLPPRTSRRGTESFNAPGAVLRTVKRAPVRGGPERPERAGAVGREGSWPQSPTISVPRSGSKRLLPAARRLSNSVSGFGTRFQDDVGCLRSCAAGGISFQGSRPADDRSSLRPGAQVPTPQRVPA